MISLNFTGVIYNLKKIAAINDLSGIGRCSLSVALPIISALKVQCCPFPTSILSSQTGYPKFTFLDLTDEMTNYYKVWKELNINFDCIYSGFLGSTNQIDIVYQFIKQNPNAFVVVDPIMGDNGQLYPIFNKQLCLKIKELVKLSNLTTPNLTEACFLTGRDLTKQNFTRNEIIEIAKDISKLGPSKVIITGILEEDNISNLAYDKTTGEIFFTSINYNHCSYSGTGDIFASILSAMICRGFSLKYCIDTATNFIYKVVEYSSKFNDDRNDGIRFENFLNELTKI